MWLTKVHCNQLLVNLYSYYFERALTSWKDFQLGKLQLKNCLPSTILYITLGTVCLNMILLYYKLLTFLYEFIFDYANIVTAVQKDQYCNIKLSVWPDLMTFKLLLKIFYFLMQSVIIGLASLTQL